MKIRSQAPGLSVNQRTFGGAHGNDVDAPQPAVRQSSHDRQSSTEAVGKRVSYDVGDTRPGPSRLPLIDWRLRLERGDQVLIAAVSGPTPMIAITRFRL